MLFDAFCRSVVFMPRVTLLQVPRFKYRFCQLGLKVSTHTACDMRIQGSPHTYMRMQAAQQAQQAQEAQEAQQDTHIHL